MDRGHTSQQAKAGGTYDPHAKRFGLLLLMAVTVGTATAVLSNAPERLAHHEQRKSETLQRTTARLREQAVSMLPPDATEVTVTRDDWPVGWLTFVRVEGGKSVKFLVCYRYDRATAEVSLSIARAD